MFRDVQSCVVLRMAVCRFFCFWHFSCVRCMSC